MLCQNCNRNDASVHLKRIRNGEYAEIHLCTGCAGAVGAGDITGFSQIGDIFGSILVSSDTKRLSNKVLRCETCGFSFEDIARTGNPGCPDCYRVFAQKMRPLIHKLHGRAVFKGNVTGSTDSEPIREEKSREMKISELQQQLNAAVAEQNFELAAVLRDEIKALSAQEDN